jgi:hypothetical protein
MWLLKGFTELIFKGKYAHSDVAKLELEQLSSEVDVMSPQQDRQANHSLVSRG